MRIAMLLHKSVEFDSRVRREASTLARAGHEVVVLELAPVAAGAERLEGFTRRSVLVAPRVRRALPFALYRVAFMVSFLRGVLRARPEVIHAHDAAMLAPGAIASLLTGARLVYDSHELATGVAYRKRAWAWFVGALEAAFIRRCAAVITVSDGIAERLFARYRLRARPTVVRNVSALGGPDGPAGPAGPGGLRRALGLDRTVPLVLHQGAPAPARGCEILVAALERLAGVHLAFLGDPEPGYGAVLRQLITARGLSGRIHQLPSVPLDHLLAHTAEADVGVTLLQDTCENHRLALPNKLFEYIAAGVPVVASDLPEMARLVTDFGVGWSVAPDDPEAVATALRHALSRSEDFALRVRMTRAARELSWEVEQARLLDLYAGLPHATNRRRWRR